MLRVFSLCSFYVAGRVGVVGDNKWGIARGMNAKIRAKRIVFISSLMASHYSKGHCFCNHRPRVGVASWLEWGGIWGLFCGELFFLGVNGVWWRA